MTAAPSRDRVALERIAAQVRPRALRRRTQRVRRAPPASSQPASGQSRMPYAKGSEALAENRPHRRYLHWPTGWRRAHTAAIALVPILLASGIALYWPPVHAVLIPYLPFIYDLHIGLGLVWLGLLVWPAVAPPRFAGRRTLSTADWLPLLLLGVGAALTGIVLVLPLLFSAVWRALEFTGHGLFAIALALAIALHAVARWRRAVSRDLRFVPQRRAFANFVLYGVAAAFTLPWIARLPRALSASGKGQSAAANVENEFVTYSAAGFIPTADRARYRLTVDGAVDHPYTLSYDELLALPKVERTRAFQCVTGWVVPDVHWTGVRLADLVARAGPRPMNHVVEFYSSDGVYTDTLSGSQIDLSDVLLAYEIDGAPLPAERGGPVRLVVPEMYGYKSVKWVERIRVTDQVDPGYWEVRGYPINAWISGPA
jgi:DMSO/TMAO reductase YedYZ molybdopterin-dependent catalytic subunit